MYNRRKRQEVSLSDLDAVLSSCWGLEARGVLFAPLTPCWPDAHWSPAVELSTVHGEGREDRGSPHRLLISDPTM